MIMFDGEGEYKIKHKQLLVENFDITDIKNHTHHFDCNMDIHYELDLHNMEII
jgi:hypothetical protein